MRPVLFGLVGFLAILVAMDHFVANGLYTKTTWSLMVHELRHLSR